MTKPPSSTMPGIPGAAVMTDTLDFVKNLWGSMGVPGMNIPGIPGITAPTLSVEDLDKKIGDLKAVEAWLNVNMSMLRATIQGLEVQRGTMATLKSLGASFAAAVKQPEAAEKSLWESPYASAFFNHAKTATPAEPLKTAATPPDAAAGAAQMANPAIWWNMLQDQFTQAVSSAMSPEAVASATAMASEAAAQFAAAAGSGLGAGAASSSSTSSGTAGGSAPAGTHDGGDDKQAKTKPVKTGKS